MSVTTEPSPVTQLGGMKGDDDYITMALRGLECALRGITHSHFDGETYAIHEGASGLGYASGLTREEAVEEVSRLNQPYEAMLALVRAYAEGALSRYHLRGYDATPNDGDTPC